MVLSTNNVRVAAGRLFSHTTSRPAASVQLWHEHLGVCVVCVVLCVRACWARAHPTPRARTTPRGARRPSPRRARRRPWRRRAPAARPGPTSAAATRGTRRRRRARAPPASPAQRWSACWCDGEAPAAGVRVRCVVRFVSEKLRWRRLVYAHCRVIVVTIARLPLLLHQAAAAQSHHHHPAKRDAPTRAAARAC